MDKYTILKHKYAIDITRVSDGLPFAMACSNIVFEGDTLYQGDEYFTQEHKDKGWIPEGKDVGDVCTVGDTIPPGKKAGDIKQKGRGWISLDWDIGAELERVYGEVDPDLKKQLTEYFTEEMKEACLKETKALY